jgi:hypothetical protein
MHLTTNVKPMLPVKTFQANIKTFPFVNNSMLSNTRPDTGLVFLLN